MDKKKIPVDTYSRVVGYYEKTSGYNRGKMEEFRQRATINVYEMEEKYFGTNKKDKDRLEI